MTNRIGDRPRFPLSNQRFDKGDAENIARYYEEIISRFTGSIYGQAWGCMSNPEFEVVTGLAPFIRPKRCVLMYSVPADGTLNGTAQDKGPWNATIVLFDPAKPGQPESVGMPTAAFFNTFPGPRRPWILFRRSETDTAVGNKAWWDTSTNTEEVGAAPLQRSEYVEFRLSVSYSPSDRSAGWHRCAYIDSWGTPGSAATPVIVPIHWMDSLFYNDSTPPVQGTRVGMAFAHPSAPAAVYETGFDPTRDMPELGKLMHWVTGKLGQHYSTTNVRQLSGTAASSVNLQDGAFTMVNDGDGGWLSTPPRGLVELDEGLTYITAEVIPAVQETVNSLFSKYTRTTRLLHVMYVTPVGNPEAAWTTYTFEATVGSETNASDSFSPTLVNAFREASADELVYSFTPLSGGGAKVLLRMQVGSNFVTSAVRIHAHQIPSISLNGEKGLMLTQNYMVPGVSGVANIPPLSRTTEVQFVVDADDGTDQRNPFTVYIYGRNV